MDEFSTFIQIKTITYIILKYLQVIKFTFEFVLRCSKSVTFSLRYRVPNSAVFPSVGVTRLTSQQTQSVQAVSLILTGNERFQFRHGLCYFFPTVYNIFEFLRSKTQTVFVGTDSSSWGRFQYWRMSTQVLCSLIETKTFSR